MPRTRLDTNNTAAGSVKKNTGIDNEKTDRTLLAESVNAITYHRDGFKKACEDYENINDTTIKAYDQKIEVKKQEFDDAASKLDQAITEKTRNLENELEQLKIEKQQAFRRNNIETAISILDDNGMVPVKRTEHEQMIKDLRSQEAAFAARIKSMEEAHHNQMQEKMATLDHRHNLEKQAEIAKITAELQQKNSEIQRLEQMIVQLRSDVTEARDLVKSVASAAQPRMMQQQHP